MVVDTTAESEGLGSAGSISTCPGRSLGFVSPLLAAVFAIAMSMCCYIFQHQKSSSVQKTSVQPNHMYSKSARSPDQVPFVLLNTPDFRILHRNLEAHRTEMNQALRQLSQALEVALRAEASVYAERRYSDHLREKIHRLAKIYEDDHETLKQILSPFSAKLMLTSAQNNDEETTMSPNSDPRWDLTNLTDFTWWRSNNGRIASADVQPYDAPAQVIAHLVRDWSNEGELIRNSLYTWCVNQLQKYSFHREAPILVPGAGLGRLAWELATKLHGCSVEAIEASLCMAAAAYAILNKQFSFPLHAYALDPFTNEVDSTLRYDRVWIQNVDSIARGILNFSYTVGDFNYEYMHKSHRRYSAVVTCFFIDTATTVYDYVSTIDSVLEGGGLWVNVGPLQWHRNNQLPVAADELRILLESFCGTKSQKPVFDILFWKVDSQPVNYRADGLLRSTHYDAYCPLRFVLRKKNTASKF